jgi:PAS domain S-box-containing protein
VQDELRQSAIGAFLWANTREGMAFVDAEGIIREANPAMCEMLGYGHSELIGTHFREITMGRDYEADATEFASLVAGEIREYSMVKTYRTKAQRLLRARLRVIPFETGVLFCGQVLPIDTLALDSLPPEDEKRIMSMLVGRWVLEHWRQVAAAVAAIGGLTNIDRILAIFG